MGDTPPLNKTAEALPSLTLYPRRRTAILMLLLFALFVTVGIVMGVNGGWVGFLVAGFFALGLPIALVQLIPGSTCLRLDASGFTFVNFFRATTIGWSLVDEFFVMSLPLQGGKWVGLRYASSAGEPKLLRRISQGVAGCDGILPDTYGKKPEELAALLNECLARVRAMGAATEQGG